MAGEAPYRLDDQIGYLLRLAGQRHVALFQSLMEHDLTPTQFAMLIRLGEVGQGSQNQLGRMIGMDVATTKGVIDRLKAKALITLAADPADSRRRLIALSEDGIKLLPALQALGHQITDATLGDLDKAERATLLALLRRIS
ncbi:MarR family transcriptional regulator [Acuticoccus sp. MNP-M23]|uniref:MarR family winged helix-turn-helix transcriptional regulator n=1 Tax=Acuticoccus sp. MNP-M23 TaxID=3072793 RepID=UPI002814FF50|nr:MarR family transcriptional regulator [Acuticoccus sp. MNP-M23]WMS44050.1 MarR family transcriptional regulator [Acuticoccus sp. MNP-M23]